MSIKNQFSSAGQAIANNSNGQYKNQQQQFYYPQAQQQQVSMNTNMMNLERLKGQNPQQYFQYAKNVASQEEFDEKLKEMSKKYSQQTGNLHEQSDQLRNLNQLNRYNAEQHRQNLKQQTQMLRMQDKHYGGKPSLLLDPDIYPDQYNIAQQPHGLTSKAINTGFDQLMQDKQQMFPNTTTNHAFTNANAVADQSIQSESASTRASRSSNRHSGHDKKREQQNAFQNVQSLDQENLNFLDQFAKDQFHSNIFMPKQLNQSLPVLKAKQQHKVKEQDQLFSSIPPVKEKQQLDLKITSLENEMQKLQSNLQNFNALNCSSHCLHHNQNQQQNGQNQNSKEGFEMLKHQLDSQNQVIGKFLKKLNKKEKDGKEESSTTQEYKTRIREIEKEYQFMQELKGLKDEIHRVVDERHQDRKMLTDLASPNNNAGFRRQQQQLPPFPPFLNMANPLTQQMQQLQQSSKFHDQNRNQQSLDEKIMDYIERTNHEYMSQAQNQVNPLINQILMNQLQQMSALNPMSMPYQQQPMMNQLQQPVQQQAPITEPVQESNGDAQSVKSKMSKSPSIKAPLKSSMQSKFGSKVISKLPSRRSSYRQNQNAQNTQALNQIDEEQSVHSLQINDGYQLQENQMGAYKQEKDNNGKYAKLLRKIFRVVAFPIFLEADRVAYMLERRTTLKKHEKVILQNASLLGTSWALACSKGMATLFKTKEANLFIFYNEENRKPSSVKEHTMRCQLICQIVDQFFMGLNFITKQEFEAYLADRLSGRPMSQEVRRLNNLKRVLKPDLLQFLGSIALGGSFFPDKYLFQYEINRLTFSRKFGFITNVSSEQSKMLIAMFLIVRVFARNVIKNAYYYSKMEIKKTPQMDMNFRILASVLTDIFVQRFSANIPENTQSQKDLNFEFVNIPCIHPLASNGPQYYQDYNPFDKPPPQDFTIPSTIFFQGQIPNHLLQTLYDQSPNWLNKQFDNANKFLDIIYKLVLQEYDRKIVLPTQKININALCLKI